MNLIYIILLISFTLPQDRGWVHPETGWEIEQKKDSEAFAKLLDENWPMGRMGTPEEVAQHKTSHTARFLKPML